MTAAPGSPRDSAPDSEASTGLLGDAVPKGLRTAWDSSPALISVTLGPQHLLMYQNAASARVFGRRQTGVSLPVAFPELAGNPLSIMTSVRETGRVVDVPNADAGIRDVHGEEVHLSYVLAPLGVSAPYDGVVITSVDVSAQARATQAVVRAELMSRIAERMSSATDPDAALLALTDQLVPAVADLVAVYVVPGERERPKEGERSRPPVAMTISADLLAIAGQPPTTGSRGEPSPWEAALAAGKTVVADVDEMPGNRDPATGKWLADADARTIVVVPLAVAGDLIGALVLLTTSARAAYGEPDIAFLEHVAFRAGTAVANARGYQQQQQMALNLQRALLPAAPPPLLGLTVAARYLAGSDEAEVGGDWWDVHDLGAGRVGIGVGDVSGRGVPAAIVMGQARSGMRAAAHADLPPADLLTVLDAQVTELVRIESTDASNALHPPRFATAMYAVIEPFDQTLRLANAGHPPLLLRAPTGEVRRVSAPPGPPLGLGVGGYEETAIDLAAGSLLVAFTDGLVESSALDIDVGIDMMVADLARAEPDADLEELADLLLTRRSGDDDVALVLLRTDAAAVPVARFRGTLGEVSEVPETRRQLTAMAAEHVPELAERVEHVAAELLANAMSHVGPPVYVRAQVTARRFVLEVADRSASAPRERVAAADDEHGRGLPIVTALADAWGSRITRNGKATWAELGTDTPKPSPPPIVDHALDSSPRTYSA